MYSKIWLEHSVRYGIYFPLKIEKGCEIMETIKEIAAACGVSEQSIRAWCKKNNIRKQRNDGKKACYAIDEQTKELIIRRFSVSSTQTKQRNQSNQNNQSNETKASEIFENSEQILVKDKQIEQLMQQIEAQQKTIDSLTAALENTTAALTAAQTSIAAEQALHAGTIQKQLTMQDEKPKGLFGLLRRKKKKDNTEDISR